MTTKAMIVGSVAHSAMAAASSLLVSQKESAGQDITKEESLLMFGEAFVGDNGEAIHPDRVTILPRQQGKTQTPTTDSDGLPNRLSIDRHSKHFTNCGGYVGVKFNGEEANNCIEFDVAGGWVRLGSKPQVTRGEVRDAPRQYGEVTVYWRSPPSRQVRRQIARAAR